MIDQILLLNIIVMIACAALDEYALNDAIEKTAPWFFKIWGAGTLISILLYAAWSIVD